MGDALDDLDFPHVAELLMERGNKAVHSLYGPSSLERRMLCPGSARMEKDLPESSNQFSERGTELHKLVAAVAHEMLVNGKPASKIGYTGEDADVEEILLYCGNKIQQAINKFEGRKPQFLIESQMDLSFLGDGVYGTADVLIYEPFGHGELIDWKFGYSSVTDAQHNLQIRAYALGAMQEYSLQSCTGTIVVPPGWWTARTFQDCDVEENIAYIRAIVNDARKPDAPLHPSKKACQFCKAAATCPALVENAKKLMDEPPALALDDKQIAEMLKIAETVEPWIKLLKQQAFAALYAGRNIEGYRLADGRTSRDWRDSIAARRVLEEICKAKKKSCKDLMTVPELKSPAQVEKLLGTSKAVVEKMEALIEVKAGEKKLERIS